MEERETPRIHKYGESKTTRIMTANVRHVFRFFIPVVFYANEGGWVRHVCLSGTYEISGRLIFVEQSVQDVYLHTRVAQDELYFYSYGEVNAANYVGTYHNLIYAFRTKNIIQKISLFCPDFLFLT
jgi:hypothetical protein